MVGLVSYKLYGYAMGREARREAEESGRGTAFNEPGRGSERKAVGRKSSIVPYLHRSGRGKAVSYRMSAEASRQR